MRKVQLVLTLHIFTAANGYILHRLQRYNNRMIRAGDPSLARKAGRKFSNPRQLTMNLGLPLRRRHGTLGMPLIRNRVLLSSSNAIEYQSDETRFGRGSMHLSAVLQEGDVVIYQTGNWLVDGVRVGDDSSPPSLSYALVESVQVVWTHNCEHGVVRGLSMKPTSDKTLERSNKPVEFGPEQLLARCVVEWSSEGSYCKLPLHVDEDRLMLQ